LLTSGRYADLKVMLRIVLAIRKLRSASRISLQPH
jgi:hypothetical protein